MKRLFKMIPMLVTVVLLAVLFIVSALPDIALAAKSNLELKIRAADVEVVSTTTSEVAADYESSVYTVTINEKNGNWTVSIFSKIGNNIGHNPIKLYLPDLDYGNITLDIDSASFQCRAIKSGDITATISNSSIDYVLPRGFSGSFKAGVANNNFELTSKDKYKDSKVTITNGGSAVISLPHYFTKKGWTATYTNGTQANVIEVISSDYGYIDIK
ncbi:MAG: hypothetical protein FH762_09785 [Firmicutes bacterium]|nr:hypothetical protein [Bacillota bacterium]